jgi:hypothetical protein
MYHDAACNILMTHLTAKCRFYCFEYKQLIKITAVSLFVQAFALGYDAVGSVLLLIFKGKQGGGFSLN